MLRVTITTTIVLLTAVGFCLGGRAKQKQQTFLGKLLELVPEDRPTSWQRSLQPIAETQEMKEAVGEALNYDDGVFAIYTLGARRISVYLAYWTPGKMSHRLIAAHTPDVCWVRGGWRRMSGGVWPRAESRDDTGSMMPSADSHPSSGFRSQVSDIKNSSLRVQPGERRTFVMNGQAEHVVFWHLVGGKTKSYDTQHRPPWWAALRDMWEKGLNQREEQFFVRISSNEPIEEIWDTPIVQHVVARVPGLVLSMDR